jgi:nickel transport protein
MSYAAVEVIAPDGDVVFQKGRTDRNGVFMFAPDGPGRWQITVSDGMGHRLKLDREIAGHENTASVTPATGPSGGGSFSRMQGVVTGLAIIFGICGFLYGCKAGQRKTRWTAGRSAGSAKRWWTGR